MKVNEFEVKSIAKGLLALHVTLHYDEGQTVLDLAEGEYVKKTWRTIEIHDGHIDHALAAYMNHHCDPTCYVHKVGKKIVARRPLKAWR